jgi:RND family efflux transporter MFP subunit
MSQHFFPQIGLPLKKRSSEGGSGRRWKTLTMWVLFAAGVVAGVVFQRQLLDAVRSLVPPPRPPGPVLYWTSRMNPDYRSNSPGTDREGTKLVPIYKGETIPRVINIDPQLTERQYTSAFVERGPLLHSVHAVSTVAVAEPLVGEVSLKFNAWLDSLDVSYEGQPVQMGDPLCDVYSPELVDAEGDLLVAQRTVGEERTSNPMFLSAKDYLDSARTKLRYLDVRDEQIDQLLEQRTARRTLKVYSRFSGIVLENHAVAGKYFPAGTLLYRIADLSKVWVYLYVYGEQLAWVSQGQQATLVLPKLPQQEFHGRVRYVYPYLEPKVRAVKVRLEFDNPDLLLKPGMFGRVTLAPQPQGIGLHIPRQAVLETGTRSLVYVVRAPGTFEAREITTGLQLDDGRVQVLAGLEEGEEIVTSGQMLVDSESRLRSVNRQFLPLPPTSAKTGSAADRGVQGREGESPATSQPNAASRGRSRNG